MIIDKLKEIKQLQNNTKLGSLECTKTETLDYFLVQENKFLWVFGTHKHGATVRTGIIYKKIPL